MAIGDPSEIKVPEVGVIPAHHQRLSFGGLSHSQVDKLSLRINSTVAFAAASESGHVTVGTLPVPDGNARFLHH